jgi:hypothetical protein
MATNKYFNLYKQRQEQNLLEDLIRESIKIHGIDAIYIPKKHQKIDSVFREDPLASFNDYHHMEMYIKTVDGFEGQGELFSKFGLDIKNQITFSISRLTFHEVVGKEMLRPNEGDLIYIPLSNADALYEIRHVSTKNAFYNLGEYYMYDVQCEQFAFQDENIKTGIDAIDAMADSGSQTTMLRLGAGSGIFFPGEIVYQGSSVIGADAKGTVVRFNTNGDLILKDVFGVFATDLGSIIGDQSSANFVLQESSKPTITNDFGAKNDEMRPDTYLDFTESNPFSEEDF